MSISRIRWKAVILADVEKDLGWSSTESIYRKFWIWELRRFGNGGFRGVSLGSLGLVDR